MGFFSGIRRRIKKLIPKEVRPAIPFILAATPLAAASGPLAGIQSAALRKAIVAGAAQGLSDDEAGIKDVLRTSAIAAAPDVISGGLTKSGDALIKAGAGVYVDPKTREGGVFVAIDSSKPPKVKVTNDPEVAKQHAKS